MGVSPKEIPELMQEKVVENLIKYDVKNQRSVTIFCAARGGAAHNSKTGKKLVTFLVIDVVSYSWKLDVSATLIYGLVLLLKYRLNP